MVPTLRTTLGVNGFRPMVGTWDCKDLASVFGTLNLVTGKLSTNIVETRTTTRRQKTWSRTRWLRDAFLQHLRHLARVSPKHRCPRVILVIDNAPWHRGQEVERLLKELPHIELSRLSSYSPQLNLIERFWKILRRRATHNRLFETLTELRQALRDSICSYQTFSHRLISLIGTKNFRTLIPTL